MARRRVVGRRYRHRNRHPRRGEVDVGRAAREKGGPARLVDGTDGEHMGRLAGYSSGLPPVRLLPAAATTSEPELTVTATIASSSGFCTGEPRLRLMTPGPFLIAASRPSTTSPTVMPVPSGLASQAWSVACGYTPTRPRPFAGAPTTEATAVPCSSERAVVLWGFSARVAGRVANSSCVRSTPVSITVTGFPGPGGSARSRPTDEIHHS